MYEVIFMDYTMPVMVRKDEKMKIKRRRESEEG